VASVAALLNRGKGTFDPPYSVGDRGGRLADLSRHGCLDPAGHSDDYNNVLVQLGVKEHNTHMGNIRMRYSEFASGRYMVLFMVPIPDQAGQPVAGAAVSARWTFPDASTQDQRAVIDRAGRSIFRLKALQTGTCEVCVTDVEKDGYLYDPDQNFQTCETVALP
jgi:hypothetical protein